MKFRSPRPAKRGEGEGEGPRPRGRSRSYDQSCHRWGLGWFSSKDKGESHGESEGHAEGQEDAQREKDKAIGTVLGEIEKQFGKGAIMRLGRRGRRAAEVPVISTGSLGLDIALGTGGLPRGRIVEVYGPESSGQDDAGAARGRGGAAGGRRLRVHRRGARAGRRLRAQAGGQDRGSAAVAAGQRRAGAGDHRDAGAVGGGRRHRHRLGGGAGAQGRARGRDGRLAHGPAGAADEPGAAQADRRHRARQDAWSSSSTSCA